MNIAQGLYVLGFFALLNDRKKVESIHFQPHKYMPTNADSRNAKKIALLENSIEEIEEKIRALEVLIEANSSDCVRLKELFEEKEEASKELERAYTEWYQQNQA